MLAQVAFWTLAPAISQSAPPLDVVEMYAWGREGVVATFKHPNLPGLILEASRRATGQIGWPAYLVSQLFVAGTYASVFALGRELMDARRALAGTLLLAGVYFFSWPTPEFNHNVAQMPFWALTTLLLWRAVTQNKLRHWLLLGFIAGFGVWAKYSFVVLLAAAAAWLLWDGEARKRLLSPGPWAGLVVFVLIAAPQALWLVAHDFQSLHYAEQRAGGAHWYAAPAFLATMALDCVPMLAVAGLAGLFGKAASDGTDRPNARAIRFLYALGLGPLALTALGALVGGAGLRASWGAPMLSLIGLIGVALWGARIDVARTRQLGAAALALVVLTSGAYFVQMRFGAQFTNEPLRGNWPQAELSQALESAWYEQVPGQPLRIVAGDIWTAGLVGMGDSQPPSVLINGDYATSPWITPERVAREGVLVVWREGAPPPAIAPQTGERSHVLLRYRQFPHAPPLRVDYAVIPPQQR
jgi:4-amino-4-deoxy-L-arabinose transferase-like glycosyltransferase